MINWNIGLAHAGDVPLDKHSMKASKHLWHIIMEILRNVACIIAGISIVALSVYAAFTIPEAETFLTFISVTTAGVSMLVLSLDTMKSAFDRFQRNGKRPKNSVTSNLEKSNYDFAPTA